MIFFKGGVLSGIAKSHDYVYIRFFCSTTRTSLFCATTAILDLIFCSLTVCCTFLFLRYTVTRDNPTSQIIETHEASVLKNTTCHHKSVSPAAIPVPERVHRPVSASYRPPSR